MNTLHSAESSHRWQSLNAMIPYLDPVLIGQGLSRLTDNSAELNYFSKSVSIEISHDHYSFEISIYFVFGKVQTKYSLGDVLEAASAPAGVPRIFQASSRERMVECAAMMASALELYARPAINGDPVFVATLQADRDRRAELTSRRCSLETQIRADAEIAWSGRDYAKVKDLYSSIEMQLNDIERRRLDYARNRK